MLKTGLGFDEPRLTDAEIAELEEAACLCRRDVLTMTTLATCGHPGGSMSSMEMYLLAWTRANLDPKDPASPARDYINVSHGHTSPGVYAVLGRLGFFDLEQAVATFRLAGSPFEGHVERDVPGIEWSSGNLGQGLSAACGFALGSRLLGHSAQVFCVMSDGEQQKGQPSEARRLAAKYGLNNVTVLLDLNGIQISGHTVDVMPQEIGAGYEADGWRVLSVDGHDLQSVYGAMYKAVHDSTAPYCILCRTLIGKGVSFMEDVPAYHGKALSAEQYAQAVSELGLPDELPKWKRLRDAGSAVTFPPLEHPKLRVDVGTPRTYGPDDKTDNRSGYGNALSDVAEATAAAKGSPIAVLDCDLASSVKTDGFAKKFADNFIQCGVAEHNAATTAGALSTTEVLTFFSDFGVFGFDETYNQHRLSDINHANLKLVCTHCGLDVGEDGKTHQCIDYVGTMLNLPGFGVIIPADPNQTDRAVRYIAAAPGSFAMAMGRSKMLPVLGDDGSPFFAGDYEFVYGRMDKVREGRDATVIALGAMLSRAVEAHEKLLLEGVGLRVLSCSCPAKLDVSAIRAAAEETGAIITYEDHIVTTGLGAAVATAVAEGGIAAKFARLGVRRYASSGTPDALYAEHGLSPEHLADAVKALVSA